MIVIHNIDLTPERTVSYTITLSGLSTPIRATSPLAEFVHALRCEVWRFHDNVVPEARRTVLFALALHLRLGLDEIVKELDAAAKTDWWDADDPHEAWGEHCVAVDGLYRRLNNHSSLIAALRNKFRK